MFAHPKSLRPQLLKLGSSLVLGGMVIPAVWAQSAAKPTIIPKGLYQLEVSNTTMDGKPIELSDKLAEVGKLTRCFDQSRTQNIAEFGKYFNPTDMPNCKTKPKGKWSWVTTCRSEFATTTHQGTLQVNEKGFTVVYKTQMGKNGMKVESKTNAKWLADRCERPDKSDAQRMVGGEDQILPK